MYATCPSIAGLLRDAEMCLRPVVHTGKVLFSVNIIVLEGARSLQSSGAIGDVSTYRRHGLSDSSPRPRIELSFQRFHKLAAMLA